MEGIGKLCTREEFINICFKWLERSVESTEKLWSCYENCKDFFWEADISVNELSAIDVSISTPNKGVRRYTLYVFEEDAVSLEIRLFQKAIEFILEEVLKYKNLIPAKQ